MRVDAATTAARAARLELHPLVTRAQQSRTLAEIFRRLEKSKGGVVQLDLDLTTLMPAQRTRSALQAVAQRFGVPELTRQPQLPGYTDEAWASFLEDTELQQQRPDVDWKALYADFRAAYWYGGAPGASRETGYVGLETDQATPGLAAFVKKVRALGGEVVFNSGRGEQAKAGTLAALRRAGIEKPRLMIGSDPKLHGGEVKALRQAELDALGPTVAVIDDRRRNRKSLAPETPGALMVAIAIPGFSVEAPLRVAKHRISTFETY